MPDQDGWQDLTNPSHWNGGIGVPFPARAWVLQNGELSTTGRTWQSWNADASRFREGQT